MTGESKEAVCCLCGFPVKGTACPHPWYKAFSEWPRGILDDVHKYIRGGARET